MTDDPCELQNILDTVEEIIYHQDVMKVVDILDDTLDRFKAGPAELWTGFLLKMGWVNTRRRRLTEANNNYNDALEIIEKHLGEDPEWERLKQEYMWGKGRLLRFSGEVDEAITLLEEALELRRNAGDLTSARPHLDIAPILGEKGRMSEALDHYRQAIVILEKTDKLNELARSYNNISDAYIKIEDYESGLEYATKCITLSGEIGNSRVAGFGAMNGGEALVRLGDPVRAREFYEICKESWGDTKVDYELGSQYLLLGMIETLEGNFKEAEETFDEADIFMESQDRIFYSARVKHEYGILLIFKGELELARGKLKEAEAILEKFDWDRELDFVRAKLAEIEESL